MTVTVVAIVVAVVVIGVLGYLLVAVRRQVRRLAAQVARLQSQPEQSQPGEERSTATDNRAAGPDVPVITTISSDSTNSDEGHPTTRRVASVTLAGPLVKAAAFSHGVRRALDDERRMRLAHTFRKELRRQRKVRRRRDRGRHLTGPAAGGAGGSGGAGAQGRWP
ncbi:MAG: hypothetical protein ACRDQA_12860 [Nocardioidaceae bacterium]